MDKVDILFLAANPNGTVPLELDNEVREIEAKIRSTSHRDSLRLTSKWALRPDDLLLLLNEHSPNIVHFSGHGTPTNEIVLLNEHSGRPQLVSQAALVKLFTTLKKRIRVVVLSACYSRAQADAITQVIDCAVGMNTAVGDEAAIVFASSFYRAIGFGHSIKSAFDQSLTALMLAGIPEVDTPELIARDGVDPGSIFLIADSGSALAVGFPQTTKKPAGVRQTTGARPANIFYIYSHEDETLRNRMDNSLKLMQRQGLVASWHDRDIGAGTQWKNQIDHNLDAANIILLLVSSDFLASDYIWDVELKRAMERHATGEARVIPIILRPCEWKNTPFAELQALPRDGRPVTQWADTDEPMLNIAEGIRRVVEGC